MLTLKPSKPTVVSQSVFFFAARIGVVSACPGPNKRIKSKARKAEATNADLLVGSACTRAMMNSLTYTVAKKGPWGLPLETSLFLIGQKVGPV